MATITSATSGNWSDGATWVGGVVPTAVDDVIIGAGHTVTADVDITVLTISGANNTASNVAVTTNRTITCTGANGITAKAVSSGLGLVRITGAGITVNINANLFGGLISSSSSNLTYAVSVDSVCTVNIVGNLSGVDNTTDNRISALNIDTASTVNVTGNVAGSGATIRANNGCTLNIIGNLLGNSSAIGSCVNNVNGVVTINVIGNCTAQSGRAILGLANSLNNITINGTVTASNTVAAVQSLAGNVTVSTPCFNAPNGTMAVFAPNIKLLNAGTSQWQFATDVVNNNKTLYSAGVDLGNPATTDVRDGVSYASGALTGTLKVPPSTAVSVGVPVDNTVGSAVVTVSDLGALLASYNV